MLSETISKNSPTLECSIICLIYIKLIVQLYILMKLLTYSGTLTRTYDILIQNYVCTNYVCVCLPEGKNILDSREPRRAAVVFL